MLHRGCPHEILRELDRETAHLILDIANLLLDILLCSGSPGGKGSAVATVSIQVFLSGAGVQVSGEGDAGLYVRNVLSERRNLAKVFHCGVAGLRYIQALFVGVVEGGAWVLSCSYDFHVFSAAVAVRAAHEPCIALVLFGTVSTLCVDKYLYNTCVFPRYMGWDVYNFSQGI